MFLKTAIRAAAAALVLGAAGAASAAVVTLDFNGVVDPNQDNSTAVGGFYNGGTSGHGTSGTNYGVGFSSNALAINDYNGCCEPDSPAKGILFFLSGGAVTVNVAAGFDTGFSFFYSSNSAAFIKVYDGLDASGNVLATLSLATQSNLNCPPGSSGFYCNWDAIGVSFSGIAKSIDFGGGANFVAYDRVTFGSADPTKIPEPTSLALVGAALLGAAAARRRKA